MAIQRILCPVDLSKFGQQAIQIATSMARSDGGQLLFLYVALPEIPAAGPIANEEIRQSIEGDRVEFEKIRPTDPSVHFEHHLVRGEPVQSIIEAAKQFHADLIVMPTHGRSGLSRLLMGSVTENVVRKANCPVLIVKAPSKTNAHTNSPNPSTSD